jgi:hypothetical protein
MNKVIVGVLVAAAALATGTARAGGVSWSIDINTPVIGTVISNAPAYRVPVYAPAPVYAAVPVYQPAYAAEYQPVYQPEYQPVYRSEYRPGYRPVYRSGYRPVPVVYVRGGTRHWDRDDRHHDHRGDHWRDRDERREGARR